MRLRGGLSDSCGQSEIRRSIADSHDVDAFMDGLISNSGAIFCGLLKRRAVSGGSGIRQREIPPSTASRPGCDLICAAYAERVQFRGTFSFSLPETIRDEAQALGG